MKAKTIDRLNYTKNRTIKFNGEGEKDTNEQKQGYSKCPECGEIALVHEGGCEHCSHCSYSRCG